jgi:predicted HTH transcriptional regulator
MEYLKKNGRITNAIYQRMNQVTRSSAMWDLRVLSDKNLVKKNGSGRGAYYILTKDALKISSLKSDLRNAH